MSRPLRIDRECAFNMSRFDIILVCFLGRKVREPHHATTEAQENTPFSVVLANDFILRPAAIVSEEITFFRGADAAVDKRVGHLIDKTLRRCRGELAEVEFILRRADNSAAKGLGLKHDRARKSRERRSRVAEMTGSGKQ